MTKVVLLSAGIGSRLQKSHPKCLVQLSNGKTIIQQQVESIAKYLSVDVITVVVGFKKELIMEAHPELFYVYNNNFDTNNTAKSLLRALKKFKNRDVMWINGDVVLEPEVVERVINFSGSCMAVNTASVAEEEIKYRLDESGRITEASKTTTNALGEAVGVNKIAASDLELFVSCLELCSENDYFERGIELAIAKGLSIYPVEITDLICTEVDFEEDLQRANRLLQPKKQ